MAHPAFIVINDFAARRAAVPCQLVSVDSIGPLQRIDGSTRVCRCLSGLGRGLRRRMLEGASGIKRQGHRTGEQNGDNSISIHPRKLPSGPGPISLRNSPCPAVPNLSRQLNLQVPHVPPAMLPVNRKKYWFFGTDGKGTFSHFTAALIHY